tara:strand:- start:16436 stop:17359 length:924 start_codon:yes stop_codon:yes gene_type:complete
MKKLSLILFSIIIFLASEINAQQRIDLDLRLVPKKEKNFYLLKKNFINKKSIKIGEDVYKITRSKNELFIDEYYDTRLHSLFYNDASLRYRQRYVDDVNTKNFIQFKTKRQKEKSGSNEFKIEINPEVKLTFFQDVKDFINRPRNQNSKLYKELDQYINTSKIIPIFSENQRRDRFYLIDSNNNTIFTVSFDEVVYSKELLNKTYFVVEFEINEKVMAKSTEVHSSILVKNLEEFVQSLDKQNILFKRTLESKYITGIKKLGLKPKNQDIIEIMIVLFALVFILILFCIPILSRILSPKNNKTNLET